MTDLVSIVGSRPQFIKLAVICHALRAKGRLHSHRIVHTGQHYDVNMSDVFFRDLDIPPPDCHLGVGSASHGEQTGEMIKRLEPVLAEAPPRWVLLYGDTNSTLAGAIASAKLHIPIAHIEAGLRSFNRAMAEEINRVVTDHVSDLLFCPTLAAVSNLEKEGLSERAVLSGDVMYDAALHYRSVAEQNAGGLAHRWKPKSYALATIHRAENTDDPDRLASIFSALDRIAASICPVVLPLHPRTEKFLARAGITPKHVHILPPASYLEMLFLEGRAQVILTDSGGVQKEAYFAQVPCVTMRDETEWVETLTNGCNVLAGADEKAIFQAAQPGRRGPWNPIYGNGAAGHAILESLIRENDTVSNDADLTKAVPAGRPT